MSRVHPPGMLLAALLVACSLSPLRLAAQSALEQRVAARQGEYRTAVFEYDAAVNALRVHERAFNAAEAAIQAARNSGDDAALAAARAAFMDLTGPRAEALLRVEETAGTLGTARSALIEALVLRQVDLLDQLDAARSAAERRDLNAILVDVNLQIDSLEAEADAAGPGAVLPAVGDVTFDPRDGPTQLENKAALLEALAARTDTVILDIDERIAALEERERNERRQRDLLAGVTRFGDLAPPTGPPGADPTQQGADSTAASGRPLTIQDRMEQLRALRQEVVERRDQLLFRAEQFRQAVRRRS